MAKLGGLNLFLVASLVAIAIAAAQVEAQFGSSLGGKIPVNDVKSNADVQELGRYCVTQYNKDLQTKKNTQNSAKMMLNFSEVIKAEKQVVAGVKYYLRIRAAAPDGSVKTFDAEIVVGPGESAKDLVTFAPSTLNRRRRI